MTSFKKTPSQLEPDQEVDSAQENYDSKNSPAIIEDAELPFFADTASARIPAYDYGYVNSKLGQSLRFAWSHKDVNGKIHQAQCEVTPVAGSDTLDYRLPGDFEAELQNLIAHLYVVQKPIDGWVIFSYEEITNFLGLKKTTSKGKAFREKVRAGLDVLRKATITTTYAWSEDGGASFAKKTYINYIEELEITTSQDAPISVQGKYRSGRNKDLFRVQIGKKFKKNLDQKFFGTLPFERLTSLKGKNYSRRLAQVVFARAGEIGSPPKIVIYMRDLKIPLAIKDDQPNYRVKFLLKRCFDDLVKHRILKETPTEAKDTHGEITFMFQPRYPNLLQDESCDLDQTVDAFALALEKYRKIKLADCKLTKAQVRKLLSEYRDVDTFSGYSTPRCLAVLENAFLSYSDRSKARSFIALATKPLKEGLDRYNWIEEPFEPCLVKAQKEEEKSLIHEESDKRMRSKELFEERAKSLYYEYVDHFRRYYEERFRSEYKGKTGFHLRRLELFESNPSTIDRDAINWLIADMTEGKSEMLPDHDSSQITLM